MNSSLHASTRTARTSQPPSPQSDPAMQVARFALDSAVPPPLTETLRVAETARFCLMGIYGRQTMRDGVKGNSPIFSGKNTDGTRLLTHGHCHYLPTDEDQDGLLDHLTLFSADGFGPAELRAFDNLRLLKPRDRDASIPPLQSTLLGLGLVTDFHPGPLKPSRAWISATPFLAPDHPKTRGRWRDTERGGGDPVRFLKAQIKKELSRWLERQAFDIPVESIQVELLVDESGHTRRFDPKTGEPRERAIQFRRSRWKRGDDGGRRLAGFFRIEFPCEVAGPLALGYSSHFGMGLFLPID